MQWREIYEIACDPLYVSRSFPAVKSSEAYSTEYLGALTWLKGYWHLVISWNSLVLICLWLLNIFSNSHWFKQSACSAFVQVYWATEILGSQAFTECLTPLSKAMQSQIQNPLYCNFLILQNEMAEFFFAGEINLLYTANQLYSLSHPWLGLLKWPPRGDLAFTYIVHQNNKNVWGTGHTSLCVYWPAICTCVSRVSALETRVIPSFWSYMRFRCGDAGDTRVVCGLIRAQGQSVAVPLTLSPVTEWSFFTDRLMQTQRYFLKNIFLLIYWTYENY